MEWTLEHWQNGIVVLTNEPNITKAHNVANLLFDFSQSDKIQILIAKRTLAEKSAKFLANCFKADFLNREKEAEDKRMFYDLEISIVKHFLSSRLNEWEGITTLWDGYYSFEEVIQCRKYFSIFKKEDNDPMLFSFVPALNSPLKIRLESTAQIRALALCIYNEFLLESKAKFTFKIDSPIDIFKKNGKNLFFQTLEKLKSERKNPIIQKRDFDFLYVVMKDKYMENIYSNNYIAFVQNNFPKIGFKENDLKYKAKAVIQKSAIEAKPKGDELRTRCFEEIRKSLEA
jgi:hypothetical protein